MFDFSWDEPRATDNASMMPTVTQFHQTGDSFLVRITNNCEVYILGLCKQKKESVGMSPELLIAQA